MGFHARARPPQLDPSVQIVIGDGRRRGAWQEHLSRCPLVINLAGASIFSRWTRAHKRLITESRVLTTMNLVDALPAQSAGVTLFSTSAIGYYGFHGDEYLYEDDPPGADFLARICRQWEAEARKAEKKGARVIITRFGIVLGRGGGALSKMLPIFRLGLGGRLGSGEQWFSWIHMEDLTGALKFLLTSESAAGAYNLTSPEPVRNRELAACLGRALHRPAILPVPAPFIRLMMGEMGNMLLKGQRVLPARLQEAGFVFKHGDLASAIAAVV
jgi:uncharacterized protein (TIGR01777 family)